MTEQPETKVCGRCLEQLPASAFHGNRTRPDGLQSMCRSCKSEYTRAWYRRNSTSHRAAVGSQRRGRERRNAAIIAEAKQVPCADCGRAFPSAVMDFDHVRGDKIAAVSQMLSVGVARLRAEIAKCEVVCANCHRMRTRRRRLRDRRLVVAGWVPGGSNPEPAD